jgi:hypothetical protein
MLTIEFALTEKEYRDFTYYSIWRDPEKKAFRRGYYIKSILSFGIIAVGFFSLVNDGKIGWPGIIGTVTGLVVLSFLIPGSMRSVLDKSVKKLIRESGVKNILPPTMLTIDAGGLFDKTEFTEIRYSWNVFLKRAMVNDCYYLYINSRQAVIIPVRAFRSPDEQNKFQVILLEHFPLRADLNSLQNIP